MNFFHISDWKKRWHQPTEREDTSQNWLTDGLMSSLRLFGLSPKLTHVKGLGWSICIIDQFQLGRRDIQWEQPLVAWVMTPLVENRTCDQTAKWVQIPSPLLPRGDQQTQLLQLMQTGVMLSKSVESGSLTYMSVFSLSNVLFYFQVNQQRLRIFSYAHRIIYISGCVP